MSHVFQKPLGWLQRFLFYTESGKLPFPSPVISIEHDWPIDMRRIDTAYTSVVGDNEVTVYDPAPGRHGLVVFSTALGAVDFPAGDTLDLIMDRADPGALRLFVTRVVLAAATARVQVPLVGGSFESSAVQVHGISPVYVPPEFRLICVHAATAITDRTIRSMVIDLPEYYPLRLP